MCKLWETTDPRGFRVSLYEDVASKRVGKHTGADHLSTDDARDVVEHPNAIQRSSTVSNREVYYSYEQEYGRPPYKRVVVEFDDDESGEAISWSRYSRMASGEVVYMRFRR